MIVNELPQKLKNIIHATNPLFIFQEKENTASTISLKLIINIILMTVFAFHLRFSVLYKNYYFISPTSHFGGLENNPNTGLLVISWVFFIIIGILILSIFISQMKINIKTYWLATDDFLLCGTDRNYVVYYWEDFYGKSNYNKANNVLTLYYLKGKIKHEELGEYEFDYQTVKVPLENQQHVESVIRRLILSKATNY